MKTGRISRTAALLTLVAAVTAAGCGAIFKGSSADVRLDASPSGVSVKNGDTGASVGLPTTLRVERKGHHVLVFEKDGYTPRKVELDRSLSAGILVLDILGGLIPVVVDAATGSWFNQTPDQLSITLEKAKTGAILTDGPDRIQIYVRSGSGAARGSINVSASEPGVAVSVLNTN